jgi:hypothetical protein
MLEGEHSLEEIKGSGLHLGYSSTLTDSEVAEKLIKEKHPNQFSRRAIEIGSILRFNNCPNSSPGDYIIAARKPNLNKTLDQFATFKSSARVDRTIFSHSEPRQNSRVKCIEAVCSLLKLNVFKSYDVVEKFKNDITSFHIFKKNQIGSVREILILTIQKRIMINILETYSRNLCLLDPREMLTHGVNKLESLRSAVQDSRKLDGKRMTLHLNFDKSKWGPSFMPCQFMYLFTRYKYMIPNMFKFIVLLLQQHHNKRCLYPERLVKAWVCDSDNTKEHRNDVNLQNMKNKFLKDKKLYFVNESNMGQGILHYTSSLLHLCLLSFRDRIYQMLCSKYSIYPEECAIDHKDLVSSDDSYTSLSLRVSNVIKTRLKIDLFLKATEISERLFNCWTSKSKSSISLVIGEFNSTFLSNMTFFPTLFKFATSSVHPLNTDSFFTMVKESYISSRQIFENGGSLELYLISQYCNKRYCEEIYHTGIGDQNDLTKMGLSVIPYHIGHFPIFDPSLMIAFGPEYYNYKIYKKFHTLNANEQRLFMNSHKIVKGELVENFAQLEHEDTIIGGLSRIEAKVGPMNQLGRLKANSPMSYADLDSMLMNDPLLIIKQPQNLEEVTFRTSLKLWQRSAAEAVRVVSASIYYGRMSASVSAKAFHVPNDIELDTYINCVRNLMIKNTQTTTEDFLRQIKFIYPRWEEYDFFDEEPRSISKMKRDPYEIQTIRKLELHKFNTKLTYTIFEILNYFWNGIRPEGFREPKMDRDWAILTEYYPAIDTSIHVTMDAFDGDDREKNKKLIMLILKLYSLKDRSIKAVCYGPSSNDLRTSVSNITSNSTYSGMTMEVSGKTPLNFYKKYDYDRLYWLHNYTTLAIHMSVQIDLRSIWQSLKLCVSNVSNRDLFDNFIQDPSINVNMKKRLLMIGLSYGLIDDLEHWTERTDTVIHHWIRTQRYDSKTNKYSGSFRNISILGSKKLMLCYNELTKSYTIYANDLSNNEKSYRLLSHLTELVGTTPEEVFKTLTPGEWEINKDRIIPMGNLGKKIIIHSFREYEPPSGFKITVDDEWTTLLDDMGHKVYKISTGLLDSIGIPEEKSLPSFKAFGLDIFEMSKLGCFSSGFNIMYKQQSETLHVLEDLSVQRIPVSDVTKIRLNLAPTWETYDKEKEDKLEKTDVTIFQEILEDSDPMLDFINLTDDQLNEIKTGINLGEDISYLSDFVEKFNLTGLFNTFQSSPKIIRTRLNWNKIKRMKSMIIAHQCLQDMKVNKKIISEIYRITRNEGILSALILYYDLTYTNTEAESPKGLKMSISGEFLNKFHLLDDDESIIFH